MWPRAVLHLDMDAFFVNVHLLEHPEDAGLPVAVGGRPGERGVIASASYEARQFGVRSAMPSAVAMRLCPNLKIVGRSSARIRTSSHQIMDILGRYGSLEQMSVDEAYVDLTGQPEPEVLARTIRQQVRDETGLPASVGLAVNKLVAKVASDRGKPEGCTIVPPGEEANFLAQLPVRVIAGIGPRAAEHLATLRIHTCGDLAGAEPDRLKEWFGRHASGVVRRAQGQDDRPVVAEHGPPKSISEEWTFSRDVGDPAVLHEKLREMAAGVAEAMHTRGLVAYTVRVKFRLADFRTFTRQQTVEVAIADAETLFELALAILEEHRPSKTKLRLLGVAAAKLAPAGDRQLRLGI
jgi:DNA polymerase-4